MRRVANGFKFQNRSKQKEENEENLPEWEKPLRANLRPIKTLGRLIVPSLPSHYENRSFFRRPFRVLKVKPASFLNQIAGPIQSAGFKTLPIHLGFPLQLQLVVFFRALRKAQKQAVA